MSEQINEQISALLDGELPEAELSLLLRQISKEPTVMQQAYAIQQARLCVQGDTPLSLSDSLRFSSQVQAAIRDESIEYEQTTVRSEYSQQVVAQAAFSQHESQDEASARRLAKAQFASGQTASNESRWRPALGAGIAAAVALVAVNAWQTQLPNSGLKTPDPMMVDSQPFSNFDAPDNTPAEVSTLQVATPVESVSSTQESSSSYTVPNFDDLNVDSPIAFSNDFRQVNYADYLLQNRVAPQSTSKQLSRFAEEQRAIIYGEFRDPRTGEIILTIQPIN